MRVDLNVPFDQKNAAKLLGARWDPARKTWFVPDGIDASKFIQWLPGVKLSKAVRKVLRSPA